MKEILPTFEGVSKKENNAVFWLDLASLPPTDEAELAALQETHSANAEKIRAAKADLSAAASRAAALEGSETDAAIQARLDEARTALAAGREKLLACSAEGGGQGAAATAAVDGDRIKAEFAKLRAVWKERKTAVLRALKSDMIGGFYDELLDEMDTDKDAGVVMPEPLLIG